MNTNNEAPSSPEATTPVDAVSPPCDLLRSLLDDPKSKDEAWQVQAGQAVAKIAVGILKGERINDHHLTLAEKITAKGKP